ncbi:MAG: hypothetical protein KTR31_36930 [Myxococcales bacterium]|nr:hypothetical protein [Myxococcales bacterium]
MPPKRRVPGQRRARSRREEQLRQLAAVDPRGYARLVELRQLNPAAFRKELARLVRGQVIPEGRGFEAHPELLALLERPQRVVIGALQQQLDADEIDFRDLSALVEEERARLDRGELLSWLVEQREALLDDDNRAVSDSLPTRRTTDRRSR